MRILALLLIDATLDNGQASGAIRTDRPCDRTHDNPGDLNPDGSKAVMLGLCVGIRDLPTDDKFVSRADWWNAYNCGYQAFRQNKVFGANPYYNRALEDGWGSGWREAEKACRAGRAPTFTR